MFQQVQQRVMMLNYDLTQVDSREYAAPLNILFSSEEWKDLFKRRQVHVKAAVLKNDAISRKQIEQIDRKAAAMVLNSLIDYSVEIQKQDNGSTINLHDYFSDFVRTKEQKELYKEFSLKLNSAFFMSDIMESLLNGCKETLKKLDPSVVLTEFTALKNAMNVLKDFTHLHHRNEHDALKQMFLDEIEECEEFLRMRVALFLGKYDDKHKELTNNGEISVNKARKYSDREYCIDLLANDLIVNGKVENRVKAVSEAKHILSNFNDDEIEEVMPVIHKIFCVSEAVHMAKKERNILVKNIPDTDLGKRIVKHILS